MVEHGGEQDESKLDFDSAGEAVAYISLEQARVLALQHARDNRDFYGRYAGSGLVWDVIGAEETEDFYEVRLSYLPAGSFRCAGVEQFTIDKTGPIEFRQIVNHPRRPRRRATIFAFAFVVVVAAAAMGGLLATGALTRDGSASLLATVATPTPMPSPAIVPNEIPEPAPQPTEFKIVGIIVPTS